MADSAIQRPKRRAIKILRLNNPDWSSSSDENTPADTHFTKPSSKPHVTPNLPVGEDSDSNHADAESSQRQSATQSPNVRRPFSSIRQASPPQHSVIKERVTVAVTSDAENYVVVDLTGHTDAQAIRERMLSKLHIPEDLHPSFSIYRTELGGFAIGAALDDNQLLIDCQHFGDDKGTLKFLAQRADGPSESPHGDVLVPLPPPTIVPVPPMVPSLSSFSPSAMRMPSSRRPGSASPGSDQEVARSSVQTLHRRPAPRRGRRRTSRRVRRRGSDSDTSDMSPIAPQPPVPPGSSLEYLSNTLSVNRAQERRGSVAPTPRATRPPPGFEDPPNPNMSSAPTPMPIIVSGAGTSIPPHVAIDSHQTHSRRPSEPVSAYEREMALVAEERRREEENERWMAKQRADLVSKRQQWERDHPDCCVVPATLQSEARSMGNLRESYGAPPPAPPPPPPAAVAKWTGGRGPSTGPVSNLPAYGMHQQPEQQQQQQQQQVPRPTVLMSNLNPRNMVGLNRSNKPDLYNVGVNMNSSPSSSVPNQRPTMQRPLTEYDRPTLSDLYRPPPLPQTPHHTTSPSAPVNSRYLGSTLPHQILDEREDEAYGGIEGLDPMLSVNINTLGTPPSWESVSPSSAGELSPTSPQTPEPDNLELSDNGAASPSGPGASMVGYIGHARDAEHVSDSMSIVSESDTANDSAEPDSDSAAPQPSTTISPSNILQEDIAHPSKMSVHEMFEYLMRSGCPDLTQSINPNGYSKRSIATGGFGDIYKGKLNDGTPIAIKVWRSRALDEELGKDGKRAMREIYNWSQLDHENVQKLLGVVAFDERLGMVSEWMERGNLQEYLQKNPDVDGYPLLKEWNTFITGT
ncbi:unnamed protein product [Rhizoctonia solani]|uniref:Protein kinase domain-containing protein n=1 Tax=Rhizoctonia solani TaxID=456999 RepID=A0A8H3DKP4_9AGAM|nr:unnamed protein product [Rhizoctonia solani]